MTVINAKIDKKRTTPGLNCNDADGLIHKGSWSFTSDTLTLIYASSTEKVLKEKYLLINNQLYKVNIYNRIEADPIFKKKKKISANHPTATTPKY